MHAGSHGLFERRRSPPGSLAEPWKAYGRPDVMVIRKSDRDVRMLMRRSRFEKL